MILVCNCSLIGRRSRYDGTQSKALEDIRRRLDRIEKMIIEKEGVGNRSSDGRSRNNEGTDIVKKYV